MLSIFASFPSSFRSFHSCLFHDSTQRKVPLLLKVERTNEVSLSLSRYSRNMGLHDISQSAFLALVVKFAYALYLNKSDSRTHFLTYTDKCNADLYFKTANRGVACMFTAYALYVTLMVSDGASAQNLQL